MRSRFRPSPAMIVACIALFVALGGAATAVTYVVSSNSQIGPGTVSGNKPPSGKHANIIPGSINGQDVANDSLRGADIANRSGVDTCKTQLVIKLGPICAGSPGVAKDWSDAFNYCKARGLRLPTISEAASMATNYDVPGVSGSQFFWTDELIAQGPSDTLSAGLVNEAGSVNAAFGSLIGDPAQTVCVTDPSA